VLLKGGRTLDALATATGIAFDKTGTITTSTPTLKRVELLKSTGAKASEGDEEALHQRGLQLASVLGQLSVHPISRGLVAAAAAGESPAEVTDFQMIAGDGVCGSLVLPGHQHFSAALGKPGFVAGQLKSHLGGAALADAICRATSGQGQEGGDDMNDAATVAFGMCPTEETSEEGSGQAWLFHFEHRVKASAPKMLTEVSRGGPVYMLTGDHQANALQVASQLGEGVNFTAIHADLKPEEKLAKVRELDAELKMQAAKSHSLRAMCFKALGVSLGGVAMVGDGVNDAPALAAATAGVSLAAHVEGSLPTAIEGSDVLVLHRAGDPAGDEDLLRVQWILGLARKARRLLLQNVCLALISIGGASSLTLFTAMPLWLGVVLHEGTTMLVGLNSLRLFSQLRVSWRAPIRSRARRS